MPMTIMCPWCLEVNDLPRDGPVWCKKCCHRADVHREQCDCLMCQPFPLPPLALPELPDVPEIPNPEELR